MKYVRFLLTGLSVLVLLSMAVVPSALAAKPSNNTNNAQDSNAWLVWQQQHGSGQSQNSGDQGNPLQNVVKPQNNVAHTPTITQNFVKPGTPKGSGSPTVTQNLLVKPGTLNPKGSGSPTVTQNLLVKPGTLTQNNAVKPGTLTTNSQLPSNTSKTTLTNQKLATALKAMNTTATQTQLSALAKALQTKNLKDPVIKDLNLTNADITALLNLVSADVAAGDTSGKVIADIATLLNSFGNQSSNKGNNEDENNSDNDNDENNESSPAPAPVLLYPYSYIPGYTYSFIGASNSMYVNGFGPVPVGSVQMSNGQSVTIPVPPYNLNMTWGSFGTYANWAAQFQAQNGRAPTEQDQIDFWISQALAGQLSISPTP
jgi:hypothetical protein